jgi:hypothetical protein
MTSSEPTNPEPTNETEEIVSTPATPGAQALPATEGDEGVDAPQE